MHIAKQNQESSCGARRAHSRMASEGGEASSTCDALSVLRSINNIGWADGYEYERS